jgi:hypothetical protein
LSHRRKRQIPNRNEPLVSKLNKYLDSPLQEIAKDYIEYLESVRLSFQSNNIDQSVYERILSLTEITIDAFPSSFGNRFFFDYYMIEEIAKEWNHNGRIISCPIIPKYDKEWAHISILNPTSPKNGNLSSINLVCFPEEDNTDNIDLLEYPFLFHELGHNLFFYNDSIFADKFTKELEIILAGIRLRAISDKGLAKNRTEDILQQISHFWLPKSTQKDWAHEIAVDLIALWACGPAFLKAFYLELEHNNYDAFLIDHNHPPYAFRIEVILDASEKLGLQRYSNNLENLFYNLNHRKKDRSFYDSNNQYQALTSEKLKEAVICCVLRTKMNTHYAGK